jgi:hypothetical protein
VVLEIGTRIVGMMKTAARTTVKIVGMTAPANPTSENSGEAAGITPASLINPQGGSSEPFSRMQWWQETFQFKPLTENPSSYVSLANVHHNAIAGAAGLDEMVLIVS